MSTFAIDYVQIAIPVGGEAEGRRFFGELLGLDEPPKPDSMAKRGGCWFAVAGQQLHLGAEADFCAAKKAHVALATDDLDAIRGRLDAAGFMTCDDIPVGSRRRFFTHDLFDNRVVFIESGSAT
jgi:hypothetical protein